ncbi:MAG: hypothetical protein AAGG68_30310, partial [Bacteroidota bacterium]
MSAINNYTEEFALLKKLLRTEAFRFVVVRYNHYDLIRQLEKDLKAAYPKRKIQKLNAEKTNFQEIFQTYSKLDGDLLFLENFEGILGKKSTSTGEVTQAMESENERRQNITAGLNLRRDKLAKKNNALVLFVAAKEGEYYLREMMSKMPDLWSFRSLLLDLEQEIVIERTELKVAPERTTDVPSITASQFEQNQKEIRRLRQSLETAGEEDLELKLSIYPQLTRLLVENGIYDRAIIYFDEYLEVVEDEQKTGILIDKGDAQEAKGELSNALATFEEAMVFAEKYEERNREGLCHERIGSVQVALGNLEIALEYFKNYQKIEEELLSDNPEETVYKNNLAISYEKLGQAQANLGNLEKARSFFEQSNQLEKELYESYPQS